MIRSRRFAIAALGFALIYSLIAGLQYLYVKAQLAQTTTATLSDWARQVGTAIDYPANNNWNLKQYQQADIPAENYVVISRDGIPVDIVGFVPGLFDKVDIPFQYQVTRPLDFTSSLGEHWRLAVYDVRGGTIVLGISDSDPVPNPDDLLRSASREFGETLQDALQVQPRQIDVHIDYAILSSDGKLRYAIGRIPLRVSLTPDVDGGTPSITRQLSISGTTYGVLTESITNQSGEPVGKLMVFINVGAELLTINRELYFGSAVAGVAFIVTLVLFAHLSIRSGFERKTGFISLGEALQRGEGQEVEFKEMLPFQNTRSDGDRDGTKRFATALAAFANTNAGNVFVGVDDGGNVRGLKVTGAKEREKALEAVKNLIMQHVSPAFTPEVSWLDHGGKMVMHIYVPRGDQPIYYVGGAIYVRNLAAVQSARAELVESMVRKYYRRRR